MAAVYSIESNVTGDEILAKVNKTVSILGPDVQRLKGVTIDGGKKMSSTKTEVVGNTCFNSLKTAGGTAPLIFHWIIHQQAYAARI